jgi:fatty-acyl-CoA synthase
MHGLMMDYPLTLTHILERSAKLFPSQEIVSKSPAGIHTYRYADFHRRVHSLAHGLAKLGIRQGDRVGTLCWNSSRHLELYFAIPCYGAVMHTLNLRLPSDQLAYIINHAQDRVIFVDASLYPHPPTHPRSDPLRQTIRHPAGRRNPRRRLRTVAAILAPGTLPLATPG